MDNTSKRKQYCYCDPQYMLTSDGYSILKTHPKCSSYERGCLAWNSITLIVFLISLLYCCYVTYRIIRRWNRLNKNDVSNEQKKYALQLKILGISMILFSALTFSLRIMIILTHAEPTDAIVRILTFLFTFPVSLGLFGYNVLIFSWMQFYHIFIKNHPKEYVKKLLLAYIFSNAIFNLVGVLMSCTLEGYKIAYTMVGLCMFLNSLFFSIYGSIIVYNIRKIRKNAPKKNSASSNASDVGTRLLCLSLIASIILLVAALLLVITKFYQALDMEYFIARHTLYRAFEAALVFVGIVAFNPLGSISESDSSAAASSSTSSSKMKSSKKTSSSNASSDAPPSPIVTNTITVKSNNVDIV